MEKLWEITKETKKEVRLNKPILIEGLPGIGNVGKIAMDFLVEQLKAEKLYSFFSYRFPHSVFVNEKNLIDLPKIDIYYKSFNGKKKDLLILVGDIQPIDEESCYTFCDEILKIVKHYKCSEIITTGGIGLQHLPDHPKVYCTSNSQSLLKEYLKKEMLTEKDIFGIVGPIVGVSGVLLGLGRRRGVKGVALLAETFGHPMYLGVKGAKEILKVIQKRFDYPINLDKISKEMIEIEKEIGKKTKEWMTELMGSTPAGAKLKKKEVSYIG